MSKNSNFYEHILDFVKDIREKINNDNSSNICMVHSGYSVDKLKCVITVIDYSSTSIPTIKNLIVNEDVLNGNKNLTPLVKTILYNLVRKFKDSYTKQYTEQDIEYVLCMLDDIEKYLTYNYYVKQSTYVALYDFITNCTKRNCDFDPLELIIIKNTNEELAYCYFVNHSNKTVIYCTVDSIKVGTENYKTYLKVLTRYRNKIIKSKSDYVEPEKKLTGTEIKKVLRTDYGIDTSKISINLEHNEYNSLVSVYVSDYSVDIYTLRDIIHNVFGKSIENQDMNNILFKAPKHRNVYVNVNYYDRNKKV